MKYNGRDILILNLKKKMITLQDGKQAFSFINFVSHESTFIIFSIFF